MKNILILGCSYSCGSSGLLTEDTQKSDVLVNKKGWWYFVDYFKNNDVTVIGFPAQGYWAYYQILLYFQEINLLIYVEIWIQETLEPRPTINNYKNVLLKFNKPPEIINETFKYYRIYNVHILKLHAKNCKEENKPYSLWESFFNEITKSCAQNIDKLCAEKNIKGYVWSMYGPIMKCNHFNRLPLTYIRHELKNNNLLVLGDHPGLHQTEKGNKYISKLIDKACIDMKI